MNFLECYVRHNSWEEKFRKPFGAVSLREEVYIAIEGEHFNKVELILSYFNGSTESIELPMSKIDEKLYMYSAQIDIKEEYKGLINYYFRLYKGFQTLYYGNNLDGLGGEGTIYYDNPKSYQITVYKSFSTPKWFKEGIVYQIFVDRFRNGNSNGIIDNPKKNSFIYGTWEDEPMYIKTADGRIMRWDFYGGNLKGVIEKLGYLKDLGIDVIYLNPIFEASSNHKYDTANYKAIDSMFGNEDIFKELCSKAENFGIKVVLDGVFSHTGADSIYFNKFGNYPSVGAYQSKSSSYYNWYEFSEYPDKYECWWGIDNQPNIDEMNEEYINYIISGEGSVIKKWMSLGASGWRLDVADELPDEFIKLLKTQIKDIKKDSILIGEVWEDASNKISYSSKRQYLFGEELDSVTNYPFKNSVISFVNSEINSTTFSRRIMSIYENYPRENFYCNLNVLDTHDTERLLTLIDKGDGKTIYKLIMALAIQMTMPGVPLIYYGDEAGLTGGKDPLNRKPYPWGKENITIYSIYKAFIKLRKNYKVFIEGNLRFHSINEDIICYERTLNNEKALIIINKSMDLSYSIDLESLDFKDHENIEELSWNIKSILDTSKIEEKLNFKQIKINPLEIKIYKI
ncbi:glycoside hydrolase family 13 protein [Clostridium thailandense]|uniref:glycoside hydrolase family 13 protein n=1 Tax=Clostridium thailandense TaxID=2794346 RepID=UPI00398943E5